MGDGKDAIVTAHRAGTGRLEVTQFSLESSAVSAFPTRAISAPHHRASSNISSPEQETPTQ